MVYDLEKGSPKNWHSLLPPEGKLHIGKDLFATIPSTRVEKLDARQLFK